MVITLPLTEKRYPAKYKRLLEARKALITQGILFLRRHHIENFMIKEGSTLGAFTYSIEYISLEIARISNA